MSNFSIDACQFSSVNKKIVSHSPPPSLLPSVLLRAHTHTHIHTHTTTCTHTTLTPHMYTHTSGTHVHTHHTQDISFLNGLFVIKAGVDIWGKKERKKKERKKLTQEHQPYIHTKLHILAYNHFLSNSKYKQNRS